MCCPVGIFSEVACRYIPSDIGWGGAQRYSFGHFVCLFVSFNPSVGSYFVECGGVLVLCNEVYDMFEEVAVPVFPHTVWPVEHFLNLVDAALAVRCNVGGPL